LKSLSDADKDLVPVNDTDLWNRNVILALSFIWPSARVGGAVFVGNGDVDGVSILI